MKQYRGIFFGVALLAILAGASLLYHGLSQRYLHESESEHVAETQIEELPETESVKATDFAMYDEKENEIRLSDYIGKPVVVNFWASWCPPCKREMPTFQNAWKKYGNDVTFLMVNETDGERETISTARAFMEKNGYEMPLFFDLKADAANTYYLMYLPRTLFIDAEGNLVNDHVGEVLESDLENNIKQLLSGNSGGIED